MAPYAVFLKVCLADKTSSCQDKEFVGWFVQGVLDYLDALTLPQIRKLFGMLSLLAMESPGNVSMIQVVMCHVAHIDSSSCSS